MSKVATKFNPFDDDQVLSDLITLMGIGTRTIWMGEDETKNDTDLVIEKCYGHNRECLHFNVWHKRHGVVYVGRTTFTTDPKPKPGTPRLGLRRYRKGPWEQEIHEIAEAKRKAAAEKRRKELEDNKFAFVPLA